MALRQNIVANYLGTGVVVIAPVVALPWYLKTLGADQFGLVSFVVMLQAVLGLLDAGVSQSLTREFTICLKDSQAGLTRAATLLRSFERLYWLFALLVMCIMPLFANPIANNWLNLGKLPLDTGRLAVYGATAIFSLQLAGSLYRSVLVGAQAQVSLNVVMSFCALLKHGIGISLVMIWPTMIAYLSWFAAMALLETLLRGMMAWRTLARSRASARWSKQEISKLAPIVLRLTGATLLGALVIQIDKIIVSRMVTVDLLGYYSIAWSIAMGMLQLIYPIMNAALPKVISLHDDPRGLRTLCIQLTVVVMVIVAAAGVVVIAFGHWFLLKWLSNPVAVAAIFLPLTVLLVGTAMHAIWNVGYLVWLANGDANKAIYANALALVLSLAVTPTLVTRFGLVGAAFGWVVMNAAGMSLSFGWLTAGKFERNPV